MLRRKNRILSVCILAGFSATIYWATMPSITASRFVQTIASEDFAAADKMFEDPQDEFLLRQFNHEDSWTFQARAEIESISFSQFISGTRGIKVELAYGKPGRLQFREWKMKSSHAGISTPKEGWIGFGGMAIASH